MGLIFGAIACAALLCLFEGWCAYKEVEGSDPTDSESPEVTHDHQVK
jgi:hypothetical protein